MQNIPSSLFYVLCAVICAWCLEIKVNTVTTTVNTEETTTETFYDAENSSCISVEKTNSNNTEYAAAISDNNNLTLKIATPCTTPNKDVGYCMEIQKCHLLLNQLNNSEATDFLRASRCGPSNEDPHAPKVCCGRYSNYVQLLARNPLPKRCGTQNITLGNRIFGGKEAELGEFPWLAKIVHKNSFGYKSLGCSAFLIQTKYLITAAHCIEADALKPFGAPFEILLGEHDTETDMDCNKERTVCSESPQRIRIKDIIVHPRYDKYSRHQHNDIALIHLRKGARLSEYVRPICLLDHKYEDAYEYWVSGWGKTEEAESSPVKLKTSVPVASLDYCAERYQRVNVNINRNQLCAGGSHKDSCTGDSGGPLMVQVNSTHWYAAGIVSLGQGCGRENWPGVYTNIPSYVGWVKREMLERAQQSRQHRQHVQAIKH